MGDLMGLGLTQTPDGRIDVKCANCGTTERGHYFEFEFELTYVAQQDRTTFGVYLTEPLGRWGAPICSTCTNRCTRRRRIVKQVTAMLILGPPFLFAAGAVMVGLNDLTFWLFFSCIVLCPLGVLALSLADAYLSSGQEDLAFRLTKRNIKRHLCTDPSTPQLLTRMMAAVGVEWPPDRVRKTLQQNRLPPHFRILRGASLVSGKRFEWRGWTTGTSAFR